MSIKPCVVFLKARYCTVGPASTLLEWIVFAPGKVRMYCYSGNYSCRPCRYASRHEKVTASMSPSTQPYHIVTNGVTCPCLSRSLGLVGRDFQPPMLSESWSSLDSTTMYLDRLIPVSLFLDFGYSVYMQFRASVFTVDLQKIINDLNQYCFGQPHATCLHEQYRPPEG